MATATITHEYVSDATVSPADGSVATVGDMVTITAVAAHPVEAPITLFLVNGVDYSLYNTVTMAMPSEGIRVVCWCLDVFPDVGDYPITCVHRVDPAEDEKIPNGDPNASIFPSGQWPFSLVSHIATLKFTAKELLNAPVREVGLQKGKWYRCLFFRNDWAFYGQIDEGVPVYEWAEKDFGGGQVARWPVFVRFDHPWLEETIAHLIGWVYGCTPPSSNTFLLRDLYIGIQSWSTHAVCGAILTEGFPTENEDANVGDFVGTAWGMTHMPYGKHITDHEVWCSFRRMNKDGDIVVDTPQGERKIYHLYHVIKNNAEIVPAHGTPLLEGSSVTIKATADTGNVLNLFTVNSVDRLTTNPYEKTNVQADVYVSASALYEAPPATDGTPYSFQCTCEICGVQVWSADGLPPGLTMDADTGLISGTVPYNTAAGDFTVTVTLLNNGVSTTRQFKLSTIFVANPFYGSVWEAVTKLEDAITAICELADGSVLLGTLNGKIYKAPATLDSFVLKATGAGPIREIRLLSTGTILAASTTNSLRSVDAGENWTNITNPWYAHIVTDFLEASDGAIYMVSGMGPWGTLELSSSTDDGATFAGVSSYAAMMAQSSKLIEGSDGKLVTSSSTSGYANIFYSVPGSAWVNAVVSGLSDTWVGNFVTIEDGSMLTSLEDRVYKGNAAGDTWALFETLPAWGGLVTPARIGCLYADVLGDVNAVLVCHTNGISVSQVLRSTDGFATHTASETAIDGDRGYKIIRLSSGKLLLGTNGATTNLWSSEE